MYSMQLELDCNDGRWCSPDSDVLVSSDYDYEQVHEKKCQLEQNRVSNKKTQDRNVYLFVKCQSITAEGKTD